MKRSFGRAFFISAWFRATAVSVVAFVAIVGVAQAAVTLNANIDTTGSLTVDGAATIGDGGDAISLDGTNVAISSNSAADWYSDESWVRIEARDGANSNSSDDVVVLTAGNAAPDAGEDGNDVALEAEDSILLAATDDINITASNGGEFITVNQLLLNSSDGNIRIAVDDDANNDDDSVLIQVGTGLPDAGEDGNDLAVEIQDDILMKSLGATILRAGSTPETTAAGDEDIGLTAVGGIYLDSGEGAGNEGITLESDGGNDGIELIGNVNTDGTLRVESFGSEVLEATLSGVSVGEGAPIDLITGGVLLDGVSGWVPDGAATTFTITATAASISSDSAISVSLGANTNTSAVCAVTTRTAITSFVVSCSSAPDNGATLSYMIMNFLSS